MKMRSAICYHKRPLYHCRLQQHCERMRAYQEASVALLSQEQSSSFWHWTSQNVPCIHAIARMIIECFVLNS